MRRAPSPSTRDGPRARDRLAAHVRPESRRRATSTRSCETRRPLRAAPRRSSTAQPQGLFIPGSTFKVVTADGGARLGRASPPRAVRRPRLLHRVRQEGLELRRPERARGLRHRRLRRRDGALDQLGLLQHRQGARARPSSSTTPSASASTRTRRSSSRPRRRLAQRPLPGGEALRARRTRTRSTRAGSPSGRSACS